MLNYPNINPIAVSVGPLRVHWYGIMYLIGLRGGMRRYLADRAAYRV